MVHFECEEEYEPYQVVVGESQQLHQKLSLFRTALNSSLVTLTLNAPQLPKMHEMGAAAERVKAMAEGVVQRLKEDADAVGRVCEWVCKINTEMQQTMEVGKLEQHKSWLSLNHLKNELIKREEEVDKAEEEALNERIKRQDMRWKQDYYVTTKAIDAESPTGQAYLKVVKEVKLKLVNKIRSEEEEQSKLQKSILQQLQLLKQELSKPWASLKLPKISEKIESTVGAYLRAEKRIDGFKMEDLRKLREKLKSLDCAVLSQSREERFDYSESRREVEESDVVVIGAHSE